MASEEKTASAIVFGIRWCSISVVASGRPTRTRLTNATSSVPPGPLARPAADSLPFGATPIRADPSARSVSDPRLADASVASPVRRREGESVHVVVVGCGRVGSELAVSLEQHGPHGRGHRQERRRVPQAAPGATFTGQKVVGFGFDRDAPRRGRASSGPAPSPRSPAATTRTSSPPASPARTSGSSASSPASTTPGARVIYQRLGIPTVATVSWTTDQVMRRLLPERGAAARVARPERQGLPGRLPDSRRAGRARSSRR